MDKGKATAWGDRHRDAWRTAACGAVLLTAAIVVFSWTVSFRWPWVGNRMRPMHERPIASELEFTDNWLREGPMALKFGMIDCPPSVELPTLASRVPYVSYPPGTVVPLYLLCRWTDLPCSLATAQVLSMGYQFALAVVLSLSVFLLVRGLGVRHAPALLMALVPVELVLLLPGMLSWHLVCFFADQAVLLPFALLVLLEVVRDRPLPVWARRAVGALQALVLFWGAMTDWLMMPVALALWVKRLAEGGLGGGVRAFAVKSLVFWAPVAAALGLFAVQVTALDAMDVLVYRAALRTGMTGAFNEIRERFFWRFWHDHMGFGFGGAGAVLIACTLAIFILAAAYLIVRRIRRRPANLKARRLVCYIGLLLMPCILQVYALREHSYDHNFSAQKFIIPLAAAPLVLAPLLLGSLLPSNWISRRGRQAGVMALAAVAAVAACLWANAELPQSVGQFPPPCEKLIVETSNLVAANTTYNDVVFTTLYPVNPDHPLVYWCRKQLYFVVSVDQVKRELRRIAAPCTACILCDAPPKGFRKDVQSLLPLASEVILTRVFWAGGPGRLVLLKIPKSRLVGNSP